MANAAKNAVVQRQQQMRNNTNKMAMKIPFFHGTKKEDSLMVKEFIKRFESSTESMALVNQDKRCKMFAVYLRGPAFLTWETMVRWKENARDWNTVKNNFLSYYIEEESESKFINKIDKLTQKKDKISNDFGNRCFGSVFKNMDMIYLEDEELKMPQLSPSMLPEEIKFWKQ